jgi:hypothetical protein
VKRRRKRQHKEFVLFPLSPSFFFVSLSQSAGLAHSRSCLVVAHRLSPTQSVNVVINVGPLGEPRLLDHRLDPDSASPEAQEREVEEHFGVRRDVRRVSSRS